MRPAAGVRDTMPVMKRTITIIKRDPAGRELIRYTGVVLKSKAGGILLEAKFSREDMPFMGTSFKRGDRFLEWYYTDRWYNIFEVHDRDDDRIKGWYCNIGHPAVFEEENILSYRDLALDLWVAPEGSQTVLDEDEFTDLVLDPATRLHARTALQELRNLFLENKTPGFS
jgi:uncharacterized protein